MALPILGIAMLIKLVKYNTLLSGFFQVLVGFGILFLGIDLLKDAFSTLGEQILLTDIAALAIRLISFVPAEIIVSNIGGITSLAFLSSFDTNFF